MERELHSMRRALDEKDDNYKVLISMKEEENDSRTVAFFKEIIRKKFY